MADDLQLRGGGSAATVCRVGIAVGLLLMAGLAMLLQQDRQARIDAAHRQALAVATGVDKLLYYGLRNLERALKGIASDAATWATAAPERRDVLLAAAIEGVAERQPELHSIVLVDADGRALTDGEGDPGFARWRAQAGDGDGLLVGPLSEDGEGGWWLSLAVRHEPGRWLLARLRTTELARMVEGLDSGPGGHVTILDASGVLLTRAPASRTGPFVGQRAQLPPFLGDGATQGLARGTSPFDGVERARGFSTTSGFDMVVVAGISLDRILAGWHRLAVIAAILSLLYWVGLAYLVRRLGQAEQAHAELVEELEAQADWLDQAQRAARTGVWRIEADGEHGRVSAHTAMMYGLAPEEAVYPLEEIFRRVHDDDRERVQAEFMRARDTGAPYLSEHRIVLPDGGVRWVTARGGLAGGEGRGAPRFTGTVVDVTDRHQARARVARAEAQFRALFERNPLPFWVFDEETLRFLAVNDAAVAAYGYSVDEFLSMTILDIRPKEEGRQAGEAVQARAHPAEADGVWTHQRRDGSRFKARVFSSGIEFNDRPARLVLAEDISDRVAYERELAWRASHDQTTGLATVAALTGELDALSIDDRHARYAVAFVRLREMEQLAPTLGQRVSDMLLREVAVRVEALGREYGMAGYWPGQSFVVVALEPARLPALMEALEKMVNTPVELEGGAHPIEASIGIAEGPEPGETAEQVVGHAALAAIQAWQEQVPTLAYDRVMAVQAAERLVLARRIRRALDREEFELHYQPIQRLSDGRIVALEALLRWRQGEGYVPPDLFIPLAEASGLIVPIGRWTLEQAARAHVRLAERGLGDVAIAVNVSPVQLLADDVLGAIGELRERYSVPRGALHVELTESVLMRRPQVARMRMLELRVAGVRISIDDFGTGFSSMAYLRNLPLDYVKIDRAFVREVHIDQRNASICRALISLARGLDLGTIAEGVESAEELAWLRANGCDQAQGYHIGRPVPLEQVIGLIQAAA